MKTIQFTPEEIETLQMVLVHLKDVSDWQPARDPFLIKAEVLHIKDLSLPIKIDKIYQKLF